MGIKTKLVWITGTIVLASLISGILAYRAYLLREDAFSARIDAHDFERAIFELNLLSTEYLVHPTDRVARQWLQRFDSLKAFIDKLDIHQLHDQHAPSEVSRRLDGMARTFGRLSSLPVQNLETYQVRSRRVLVARLLADSQAVISIADQNLAAMEQEAGLAGHRLLVSLLMVALVGTIAYIVSMVVIVRDVLSPVLRLSEQMDRMGKGDLETPIDMKSSDEVGQLAHTIDDTREKLRQTIENDRKRTRQLEQRDLELRKQAEELRHSNRELEQFAYIASHDLRSPLRGIAQLASWIEDDAGDVLPDEARENLELLRSRTRRMDQLLTDLLAYSRASRMDYEVQNVELSELIQEAVELSNLPPGFDVGVPADMPSVSAPRTPFLQVFTNLLSNAGKHHDRAEGRIDVCWKPVGGGFEFAVVDDGPGISNENQTRVFDMFQTLRRKDETESTGMGLTLVQRILERHGGTIRIESEEGKRGTAFHFFWPSSTAAMEGSSDAAA